jgi:iron complex outermembrane receptor protein
MLRPATVTSVFLVLPSVASAPLEPHDHGDRAPFPDHEDSATLEVEGDALTLPGAGDVRIDVRETQAVHAQDLEEALWLAPGLFMTRPGGEGAPMQVFLRGFDARHGQDVAFRIDGMPMNQVGNPHGHGLVDLRIAPPEALSHLEVRPGATDPAQGDFAVAGSLDMDLSLAEPGLLFGVHAGSFGTIRRVLGWRHPDRAGTFVLGEWYRTRGYGEGRAGQRGSVLARVEHKGLRVSGGVAASDFAHAGLVRRIDVDDERIDLYGTQDPRQGARGSVGWISGRWQEEVGDSRVSVTASANRRTSGIRYNYTGFLTDDRRPGESPHPQRGDLLDQRAQTTTLSLEARASRDWQFERDIDITLEGGLGGRFDDVDAVSMRLRAVDSAPYRTELDLRLQQTDVGGWVGGSMRGGPVTARLGARTQAFHYQLHDRCAAFDAWFPGAVTDDVNCAGIDRNGVRRRDEWRTAAGMGLAPRGSVAIDVAPGHRLLAAGGRGFRSIEATSLSEGELAPFADLWTADLGWDVITSTQRVFTNHRIVGFVTTIDRDLVFDEDLGTNIVGGPSTRAGATLMSEIHVGPLRAHTSITATYAVYGNELPPSFSRTRYDRQPGQLIPYVPPLIGRTDVSYMWSAGPVGLRHGIAATGLAPRPLPLSAWADPVFTLDAGTEARWKGLEVGVTVTNLLGARYALAEYNFASWFPSTSATDFPTRLPSRQVSPGPPRAFMASFVVHPEAFRNKE